MIIICRSGIKYLIGAVKLATSVERVAALECGLAQLIARDLCDTYLLHDLVLVLFIFVCALLFSITFMILAQICGQAFIKGARAFLALLDFKSGHPHPEGYI